MNKKKGFEESCKRSHILNERTLIKRSSLDSCRRGHKIKERFWIKSAFAKSDREGRKMMEHVCSENQRALKKNWQKVSEKKETWSNWILR